MPHLLLSALPPVNTHVLKELVELGWAHDPKFFRSIMDNTVVMSRYSLHSLSRLWVLALSAAEPEPRIDPSGEHCLSEASCAAILIRGGGGGTRRAAHGRTWFWVLLPKQKRLVARGRHPTSLFGFRVLGSVSKYDGP